MDQIKIGAFLKTLRKEKNLTQEQAAEQLGVSNRTVSRWETGTNMPDISLLVEIAELYGVSIPELIDGERNPSPGVLSRKSPPSNTASLPLTNSQ